MSSAVSRLASGVGPRTRRGLGALVVVGLLFGALPGDGRGAAPAHLRGGAASSSPPPHDFHGTGQKGGVAAARRVLAHVTSPERETSGRFPSSLRATPGRSCSARECVTIDATRRGVPMSHAAQGFLHGLSRSTDRAVVRSLSPRNWRLSDDAIYDLAKSFGAAVTWIISDSWWRETCQQGTRSCPVPPWDDWPRYEAFVRELVRRSIADGRPVDFWDVVNEPGTPEVGSGSATLYLEQFRRAHDAIRSVDPDARIVGPSLAAFADSRYGLSGYRAWPHELDLETFLDYIGSVGLKFDALSWHEISPDAREANPVRSPADLFAHVQRARSLLARYPDVGPMQIHINEYSPVSMHRVPGLAVGWLAAIEAAGVDAAMRTCWNENDQSGGSYSDCKVGSLGGLLMRDARSPRAIYWTYRAYASMPQDRVVGLVRSDLSALAAKDADRQLVDVLLGRHERCAPSSATDCRGNAAEPTTVDLALRFPYSDSHARVEIWRVPNVDEPLHEPQRVGADDIELAGGWATMHLSQVRDGDALLVSVRRR